MKQSNGKVKSEKLSKPQKKVNETIKFHTDTASQALPE